MPIPASLPPKSSTTSPERTFLSDAARRAGGGLVAAGLVWIRSRDGAIRELEYTGPLLGPVPDAHYAAEGPIRLEAGDVLLLFTDGIYDVKDEDGKRWGEERFQAAFQRRAAAARDARTLLAGLVDDIDTYRGSQPLPDDLTCLVVCVD